MEPPAVKSIWRDGECFLHRDQLIAYLESWSRAAEGKRMSDIGGEVVAITADHRSGITMAAVLIGQIQSAQGAVVER